MPAKLMVVGTTAGREEDVVNGTVGCKDVPNDPPRVAVVLGIVVDGVVMVVVLVWAVFWCVSGAMLLVRFVLWVTAVESVALFRSNWVVPGIRLLMV